MTPRPPLRVAVVGPKASAASRADVLARCEDTMVASVVPLPDASGGAAAPHEEGRLQDALDRADVDAVVICAPVPSRPDIVLTAVAAGKHVLCDQPIAETVEAADEILDASQRQHVVLACWSPDRHRPMVTRVRCWIADGKIGRPFVVHCHLWAPTERERTRGLAARSADLARLLIGEIHEVRALCHPAPAAAAAVLAGPGGHVAFVHVSGRDTEVFRLHVFGQDGYAYAEESGTPGIGRAGVGYRDFIAPFQETVTETAVAEQASINEWKGFLAAVLNGGTSDRYRTAPICSGQDAIKALRLTQAMYESDKSGRAVRIL